MDTQYLKSQAILLRRKQKREAENKERLKMERKTICKLSFKKAIEAIKSEKQVYYRHGVWNSYQLVSVETAIKGIENSGYGADVFEREGKYYVSIPNASDMW